MLMQICSRKNCGRRRNESKTLEKENKNVSNVHACVRDQKAKKSTFASTNLLSMVALF